MGWMSYLIDPITIVCFAVFAALGFRLWQVLGTRSGPAKPPPPQTQPAQFQTKPMPSDLELKAAEPAPRKIWEGYAAEGSALAKNLKAISEADANFDISHFVSGAKSAHERILDAFASGDVATLKLLLTPDTALAFEKEISRRTKAAETAAFKFVGIKEATPVEANLKGDDAEITLRFASEIVSAVKDKSGKILSGDDRHIAEVTELWTFTRHLKSSDTAWKLAETQDGA